MNSEPCLNVFVGCPPLLRVLPEGPCLILDADQAALDLFQQQNLFQEHSSAVVLQSVVLAGSDDDAVTWRRFSDSRFNGVWDRSTWFEMAPNLCELDQSSIQPATFSSVLEQPNLIADSWSSIRLFLRQGDPVQILHGAGFWLKRCSSILLRYPGMPREKEREFEEACISSGFTRAAVDDNAWIPKRSDWTEIQVSILQSLFDTSLYRQCRPDLQDFSDSDLLQHWLNSPDPISLVAQMRRSQRRMPRQIDEVNFEDPIWAALRSIFPFEFYRSLRPDLNHLDDDALIVHYCFDGIREGIRLAEGVEIQYAVNALRHVFPYDLYRKLSPDLSDLSDHTLLLYFCANDLQRGIDLSEGAVRKIIGSYPVSEVESLRVRVQELESYLDAALQQASDSQHASISNGIQNGNS